MSEAKLTILGCGSAKPTKTTSPSGQLVDLCDKSFLVDCGEGVLLTMQRLGVHTSRLYNIFISHLHGDHCFGLIGLLTTLGMLKRTQPMHIYAQPDLEKLLQPLLDYHANDRLYDIIFHPINPRKHEVIYEDRTVSVETIPLKHGVPTCGFLFKETHRVKHDDGSFSYETRKRYAYCSDTQYSEPKDYTHGIPYSTFQYMTPYFPDNVAHAVQVPILTDKHHYYYKNAYLPNIINYLFVPRIPFG